jgi:hypothetical protein
MQVIIFVVLAFIFSHWLAMVTINLYKIIALGTVLLNSLTVSWAQVTVLNFEGVGNNQQVGEFYNGGAGGDYGISFMEGSFALVSDQAGGNGNFDRGSSGSTILFFVDGDSAVMNVAGGFTHGFSFYYASFDGASVTVFSGLNATGEVLTTFYLTQNVFNGRVEEWHAIGLEFGGVARSVSFGGSANMVAFDDITLGSSVAGGSPIPEPSTYAAIFGAAALGGAMIWRRRQQA